ncbi:hypothetical protein D3C72_2008110 [compost metagenome]
MRIDLFVSPGKPYIKVQYAVIPSSFAHLRIRIFFNAVVPFCIRKSTSVSKLSIPISTTKVFALTKFLNVVFEVVALISKNKVMSRSRSERRGSSSLSCFFESR